MKMTVFLCARCRTPISKPLRALEDFKQLQDQVGSDPYDPPSLVPQGFYALSDDVLAAGKMYQHFPAFSPPQEIIFNREDLITHPTQLNENDVGCCGYTGAKGYNLFCPRGHAIGTEISDCCMVHYVHIHTANLKTEE